MQEVRDLLTRTRLLTQKPETFFSLLVDDLARECTRAKRLGVRLVCRLNVVSDVPFERLESWSYAPLSSSDAIAVEIARRWAKRRQMLGTPQPVRVGEA